MLEFFYLQLGQHDELSTEEKALLAETISLGRDLKRAKTSFQPGRGLPTALCCLIGWQHVTRSSKTAAGSSRPCRCLATSSTSTPFC